MDYLIFKKVYYIKKDRLYLTDEGKLELHFLLSQLNNKRTDFSYPENHVIRITPNWILGFIEGDGSFITPKVIKTEKNKKRVAAIELVSTINDELFFQFLKSEYGGNVYPSKTGNTVR